MYVYMHVHMDVYMNVYMHVYDTKASILYLPILYMENRQVNKSLLILIHCRESHEMYHCCSHGFGMVESKTVN